MRSFILSVLLVISIGVNAHAQVQRQSNITGMRVLGSAVAAEFGRWEAGVDVGFSAAGSKTVVLDVGSFVVPDGMGFMPISTTIPIRVEDFSSSETVTPSSVNCAQGSGICQFTATFSNAHPARFRVRSGSNGLQEAIEYMRQAGGGMVIITPDWIGTQAMIDTVTGTSTVALWDIRNGGVKFYVWTGSSYAIGWGVTPSAGLVFPDDVFAIVNGERFCTAFTGATGAAKMRNAIDNLPATGGTVTCNFESAQTGSADPFVLLPPTKIVTVNWGVADLTMSVDVTIPAGVTVKIARGGRWVFNSPRILTIQNGGNIICDNSECLAGTGSFIFQ